jgi:hypothetical protein
VREREIPEEEQHPLRVFIGDHAGLVISKSSLLGSVFLPHSLLRKEEKMLSGHRPPQVNHRLPLEHG